MASYLPEHKKADSTEISNEIPTADVGANEIEDKETEFDDPKLQAMWQRARMGGFSGKGAFKYDLTPGGSRILKKCEDHYIKSHKKCEDGFKIVKKKCEIIFEQPLMVQIDVQEFLEINNGPYTFV